VRDRLDIFLENVGCLHVEGSLHVVTILSECYPLGVIKQQS